MNGILLAIFTVSHISTLASYETAFTEDYFCENTICNPRAGDLLIGRESSLIASSTCGLNGIEAYCVVTTSGKSHCEECISKQPYNPEANPESHRVENVVSRVPSDPGRWWQSQNAVHNVSIVLNLDTQFQFISTILRFKTYRPAAMYLERSYDFGRTWARYAYFSNNCKRDFPSVPEGPRRSLTDVTCTGVYSQLTPSEGGVVAYMAAPSEMHQSWPQYSKERMNLTAITNLRAVFTRINTLGDMRVDDSPLTRRKYYYALYEWNVWGRCTCFGHASRCKPKSSVEILKPEKVYGVCECTHNTAGENCETCADFHWNKPWMPATRDAANACEKCNCNNHATACFFNPVLYIKSGNVSGGNCHGCMHNTEGVNCEFCQPNFYRHPSYPIDHPLTCQPCNCHLDGTLYNNFCQQYTIPEQNTIAGRCICKKNVGGEKCDRCKVGFWNFQAENPDGCESCSCNMIGTIDNGGCDPFTGLCTCKRFVGGPNCDRCLEGYFNLSTAPLGCQECACSQIGSLNPNCERVSGQCACKVGFTGRDCSEVENGYYVVPPHEIISGSDEKEISLIGPKGEGKYVIVLDVDPKQFGSGDRWSIVITPFQYGATTCQNPPQSVNIYQDTHKVIISDVCLEPGLPIVLRIVPESYPEGAFTEILITDIILIPSDDSDLARRCESYREIAMEILAGRREDRTGIPPECEVYFRLPRLSWRESSSVAQRCLCNSTGSRTDICDKLTGQCPCKDGVVGRQCDQCAPHHYGFSARGCTDCACDPQGSISLQCHETTSLCECRPGIVGKHCNMCNPGFWDFPNCRPCTCNGLSEFCNQTTGICENCRDNTGGDHCETCREGFYGDPLRKTPCKPCSCPGGGLNHAKECRMGPLEEQICTCKVGYTGPRCSQCAVNYFGNPTEPGGSCRPCECSGNIAVNVPGSCDSVTGQCLKCLYNTEGYYCDICKEGFWGDATRQMCQPCNCYPLGSVNEGAGGCNRDNGQCSCLPNVIGPRCYECAPYFFNLTSGKGCEPCLCDPTGSIDDLCDPVMGQCRCKPDRSGRKCDQCRRMFYSDPTSPDGCRPCNCDRAGSTSDLCDALTGQCPCRTGVTGQRCDRCDRGTEGILPNCNPCGECWNNWDKSIDKVIIELDRLQNQTSQQLPKELKILFDSLVSLLDQIEHLPWMITEDARLNEFRNVLKRSEDIVMRLSSLDQFADSLIKYDDLMTERLTQQLERKVLVNEAKTRLESLKNQLKSIMDESMKLEHLDQKGAYLSLLRSKEIADRVADIQTSIEYQRGGFQNELSDSKRELEAVQTRADQLTLDWAQLERRIEEFREKIRQTNRLICGDNSSPPTEDSDQKVCPSTCGGAGCDYFSKPTSLSTISSLSVGNDRNPSSTVTTKEMMNGRTGLISTCGLNLGCNASNAGRLRSRMEEYLNLQIRLTNALHNVYRAENAISKVEIVNCFRLLSN
ncbi:Laminin subunit beta-1 [Schistosoma japonicum]|nr:Laminin subunit beta-1 [Schistosoma japonicum]